MNHRFAVVVLVLSIFGTCIPALAQDTSLLPKYGAAEKSDLQRAADDKFMAAMDGVYKGDRSKASADVAVRAWRLLRQGNAQDAMRRFNQAWLLNNKNGSAIWGMAAIQSSAPDSSGALQLFAEADALVGNDIDFAVDHARAVSVVGAKTQDKVLMQDALRRFARLHEKAPGHTLNLQNWAIALYYSGDYALAWKKIQLAEATPRSAELEANFIADLQTKMARP